MHPLADLARPLSFKASYDTSGTWNFGVDLTETTGGGVRPSRPRNRNRLVNDRKSMT